MTDENGNDHGMPRKVAIICSKGTLDMAYPGLILANGALENGIETHLFFTFWGFDLGLTLDLSSRVQLSGSYSWLSENDFVIPDVGWRTLNVPRNKAGLGLAYRDVSSGIDAWIRGRWVESFPIGSGVYFGQIGTYIVIDVGVGYRISWEPDVRVSLNASNILDNRHQEWIGAPELGRVFAVQLQMNF